jgi:hypothetical protein
MRVRNYLAMGVVALAAVALPATSAFASVTSSPGNHGGQGGQGGQGQGNHLGKPGNRDGQQASYTYCPLQPWQRDDNNNYASYKNHDYCGQPTQPWDPSPPAAPAQGCVPVNIEVSWDGATATVTSAPPFAKLYDDQEVVYNGSEYFTITDLSSPWGGSTTFELLDTGSYYQVYWGGSGSMDLTAICND